MTMNSKSPQGITELSDTELLFVCGGSDKKEKKTERQKVLDEIKDQLDEIVRTIIISGGGGDDKPVSP